MIHGGAIRFLQRDEWQPLLKNGTMFGAVAMPPWAITVTVIVCWCAPFTVRRDCSGTRKCVVQCCAMWTAVASPSHRVPLSSCLCQHVLQGSDFNVLQNLCAASNIVLCS